MKGKLAGVTREQILAAYESEGSWAAAARMLGASCDALLARRKALGLEVQALSKKTIARDITLVYTDAEGCILSVTQRAGREGTLRFSLLLPGDKKGGCESAELALTEEEIAAVRSRLSFDEACSMIAGAIALGNGGGLDWRGYVESRVAALSSGVQA